MRWLGSAAVGLWGAVTFLALGTMGCDDKPRFTVPEYQRRKARRSGPYRIKSKVKLPPRRSVPRWSLLADLQGTAAFRPEPIRLQGQPWLRASNSQLFAFYFQRENSQAGRTLVQVSESIARFASRWLKRPYTQQFHVLVVPHTREAWAAKTASPSQPTAQTSTTRPSSPSPTAQPGPTTRASTRPAKRAPSLATLPVMGALQFVIFSGADNDTKLSEYGLVGELTQGVVRWLLTHSVEVEPRRFWRSVAIPAYFDARGTGAMTSRTYNKTMTPRFRTILKRAGYPTAADVQQMIAGYERQVFVKQVQPQVVRVATSFLGFLEDAYGRRVFVALLRHLAAHPQRSWSQAVTAVIGKSRATLWKEWSRYFYPQRWRRALLQNL